MAKRITPLDVQAFTTRELYQKGERIFEKRLVKHRFQTDYGLQACVRDQTNLRVEMIVSGEQIFGRCECQAGSSPCEHQVAVLLAWIHEPSTFTSYQTLRKAIRSKDKNTLVDTIMNLTEVFPQISQIFTPPPGFEGEAAIRAEVKNVLYYNRSQKVMPSEIIEPCRILLVHAHILKNENEWQLSRILLFEILDQTLALIDRRQLTDVLPESFITELSDEYEDVAINDPDFDDNKEKILKEISTLLDHDSADIEGVYLEQLRERLELDTFSV